MKQFLILISLICLTSCDKGKPNNKNPYLFDVSFSKEINLSLPAYNNLLYASNPILISDAGAGIKGILVMKAGENDYRAYEASCPNQFPNDCSQLTIEGINVKCSCENLEYNLYTSTSTNGGQYPLKSYRVEQNGNFLRVYN